MQFARKQIGQYQVISKVGQGQFSTVFEVININTQEKYAAKCISKTLFQNNQKLKELFKTEVQIMQQINDPSIIHLYDLLESSNNFYCIIDYCPEGDLEGLINKNWPQGLSFQKIVEIFKQIQHGFFVLRKHKVIHRDFKASNVLIQNNKIKISDFGVSKRGFEMATTQVGSPLTSAPEMLSFNPLEMTQYQYNSKSDLWSIGCVLFQMISGQLPFFGTSPQEILLDIKKKIRNFGLKMECPNSLRHLIEKLLIIDPKQRMNWQDFFEYELMDCSSLSNSNHRFKSENKIPAKKHGIQVSQIIQHQNPTKPIVLNLNKNKERDSSSNEQIQFQIQKQKQVNSSHIGPYLHQKALVQYFIDSMNKLLDIL